MPVLLLFGASGAIGTAVKRKFLSEEWHVVGASRAGRAYDETTPLYREIACNPLHQPDLSPLAPYGPFDAVCWAQGANINDSVYDVDAQSHRDLYGANCLYVVASLQMLLRHALLVKPARLCVISSIWQEITRQNKLSYSMTKAALKGLVLSAAADMAKDGHLINGVLPGVLETPMTRANLTPEQLASFENATLFHRLPALADVAYAVWSLCNTQNHSITGQFVKVDLGFSNVRLA